MQQGKEIKLQRVLNAALGAAIVVGGSIGIGILSMPGVIAGKIASPLIILAGWVIAGILALLGGNIYAELGTAFPKAGGPYVYLKRAAGPFGGFATGWSDAAVSIVASAGVAALIGELLENELLDRRAIAIAALAILGAVNWFGLKVGARTQQALSLFKVVGLVLLALACIAIGGFESKARIASPEALGVGSFITGLVLIGETYAGWNSAVYFSEEDQDTDRNIPRALFWGIGALMATYVLVNLGFLAILSIPQLAGSKLPAADAAGLIFGTHGSAIVQSFAIISLVGILNVTIMYTPRILFAMSRDGVLPSSFSSLNRFASPSWALIWVIVPAMLIAAFQSFDFLFGVTAFLGLALNASVYISLFLLRRREPDVRRPYPARWYPWAPALVTLLSIGMLVSYLFSDPEPALWAVLAIGLSWPAYQWMRWKNRAIPATAAAAE